MRNGTRSSESPTASSTLVESLDLSCMDGKRHGLGYQVGSGQSLTHCRLADAYGRKISIFVACAISLVSQALQAGAAHIGMFIAFRFFAGWG